ncbi:unnamed protein product [Psylliodes chrysocephalus]|uniref:DUF7869 domain-containing protein n=1 Tax=Psylliodes chrysocephalus TaxID=3402493 RepID=A0A9P0CXU2_9CUCU|nr:unnamed protein product [Psylliodes chrysocephala]
MCLRKGKHDVSSTKNSKPQESKIRELASSEYANLGPYNITQTNLPNSNTENELFRTSSDDLVPETEILEDCTNKNLKTSDKFDLENMPVVFLNDVGINNAIENNVDFDLPLFADQETDCSLEYEYLQPSTSAGCCINISDQPVSKVDADYVPSSESETNSDDDNSFNNAYMDNSYKNIDADFQGEEIENADGQENNNEAEWGDMTEGRKRKNIADKSEWKRNKNQMLRMKGEDYVGFSRDKNKNFKHNIPRAARKIGEPCVSKMCIKSKKRFCNTFSEQIRKEIFANFWKKMTWDQRKLFVSGHVSLQSTSRKTRESEGSRRENTMVYKLHNGKELVQVCRKSFLNTIGLGRFTIESWIKNSVYNMNESKCEQNKRRKNRNYRVNAFEESKAFMSWFFDELPKQPSHYTRKDSNKLYLEQHFTTLKQLHNFYKETCIKEDKQFLSPQTFKLMFKEKNLSLFSPKKDRCDVCIEYENKNIDENLWKKHIDDKGMARKEQSNDKAKALKKECILLCMDLQAVKVAPSLNATKIYFKTKLSCHNFTVYNSASHHVTCYWFTEIDCGLQASTFVSCVLDYLERHCLGHNLPIIIYSDGCTFQNRNNILSNALLNFAIMHRISITQKYLTKGHTQMECDSVHSCIERKLRNRVIELPSDYVKASMEARIKPEPYEVTQLRHTFFNDYSLSESHRYSTIRPGRDNLVTDIKALYYDTNGEIKVKLDFSLEFQNLPCRPKQMTPILNYPKLYKERLPITQKKWKHLQELKSVISQECHLFYDNLPYIQDRTGKNIENPNGNSIQEIKNSKSRAKQVQPKKRRN